MLKVSPWKRVIRFGKRGKLNPRYIGPLKILARVGTVAYQLELLEQLNRVHSTFHVSNLKKYLSDETQVISLDEIHIGDKLHFIEEPVEIMDHEFKRLKQSPQEQGQNLMANSPMISSVLSSRWRFIWTSMPTLNFKERKVHGSYSRYHEFVNNVLSVRNNKIDYVSSVSLKLAAVENLELSVERILEYAFSHNVQQLSISIWNREIPPSRLKSKSLKHLTMIGTTLDCPLTRPPLSGFGRPGNLVDFELVLSLDYSICECDMSDEGDSDTGRRLISVHKLAKYNKIVVVIFDDIINVSFESGFGSERMLCVGDWLIEKSNLYGLNDTIPRHWNAKLNFLCLLRMVSMQRVKSDYSLYTNSCSLHRVKSLALSLDIVELLSTSEEVISYQPSPFPSLKSLKIYLLEGLNTLALLCLRTYQLKSTLDMFQTQLDEEQEAMKRKLAAKVTNYLLGSSLNATFTMVSREEARAIKITTTSYRLMAVLWEILEEMEAYTETKRANAESKKTLADGYLEYFEMIVSPVGDSKVIFACCKI
ncbi:hypothetical protein Tco_0757180 [Tanacetum coccineum]